MRRWRCRPYQAMLVDRAEGNLALSQGPRLDRHLQVCRACRDELTALREVPSLLRATAMAEPDEDFWRQQRQTISTALRQTAAPQPRSSAWRLGDWRASVWRYPIAVAAGLLFALGIYHLAADHQPQAPDETERQLAGLDTDSLSALREIMQGLGPADEQDGAAEPDDTAVLAAAPLSDFGATLDWPPVLQTTDLSDTELDRLDTLVGDEFG